MSKIIPLTQGKQAIVDDEDFDELSKYKWRFEGRYAARNVRQDHKKIKLYMHRVILDTPEKMETDHIDGNKLNNSRGNLRACSRSYNLQNRSRKSTNTSGYKGVSWSKDNGKWEAYMSINGKKRHLGYFINILEAARSYDNAVIKYYGDFARLNFEKG